MILRKLTEPSLITTLELIFLVAVGFVLGRGYFGNWVVVLIGVVAVPLLMHWWRGWCGLDQWPNPYGRYYRQWHALKNVGDYYAWLAHEMGGRDPWRRWADLDERSLGTQREAKG